MWIKLSDGTFFFGAGGVTVMKSIDLRDKPSTYIYRTELLCGVTRVDIVKETTDEIMSILSEATITHKKGKKL
jgi:hypothetical protein